MNPSSCEITHFSQPPETFRDFIEAAARIFGQRIALIEHHGEDRKSINYRQLSEQSNRVANFLRQAKLKKGDRIALLSENRLEWVISALAVLSIGAVLVPLDHNLANAELALLIKRSKSKWIITSRALLTGAFAIQKQSPVQILCFDPIAPGEGLHGWRDIDSRSDFLQPNMVEISPDDTALLVYTSGTTSDPKGVMLTHRNILSSAWWTFQHTGVLHPESRVFFAIPLFHMFTFTVALLSPFMTGGTVILGSSLKPAAFRVELQAARATLLIAVPLIFESIQQSIMSKLGEKPLLLRSLLRVHASLTALKGPRAWERVSRALYSRVHELFGGQLKFLVSGGASLQPDVATGLERLGFTVLQGYGMTEAGPVIASESTRHSRLGSVGRPLSHLKIRISRPDRKGIGEIQVRGEAIMRGYEGPRTLNREAFEDGWLKTGDLGYLDRDGFLYICGRHKDLIVTSGGKKIYPEELERIYLQSRWIKEICIQEKNGPKGYEGLHATIVPDLGDATEPPSELEEIIREELQTIGQKQPIFKRIDAFTISMQELSKTTLKKLKRHAIRRLASVA